MPYRSRRLLSSRILTLSVALAIAGVQSAATRADDEIGLQAPQGFTVTRFADDSLAHDVFSMTLDSLGRVVVSGPGYVKILIDRDGDGKADEAKTFAEGPATGAQGMFFHGRDLLCTGDAGLIRYRDENRDDQADGPPETFLKILTGGEHTAHALRKGPDGWWYLIAGNMSEVNSGYATLPTSPVKNPHGGVILRLKPDLTGGDIYADEFRNAYDFDFDARGEMFVYESDGERDVGLPWYLPTRLFQVLPGQKHGWVTDSWKAPDYLFDSAPVAATTGRGSPTGVVTYRHTQFPEKYQGAVLILDWTFGRILAVQSQRQGAAEAGPPVDFITAKGQFGFAPTDAVVGVDGSLFVCVGGRGTHGAVYRIAYIGEPGEVHLQPAPWAADSAAPEEQLTACLDAPQPLESWSRARWTPLARKLGAAKFIAAALNEKLTPPARTRAIEIVTELFGGLPLEAAESLITSPAPDVRARVAWSLGVARPAGVSTKMIEQLLGDDDALVRRRALEALPGLKLDLMPLARALALCMKHDDRLVRLAAARLIPRMPAASIKTVAEDARHLGWKTTLTFALGLTWRGNEKSATYCKYAVEIGRRILESKHPAELKLEAVRLLQLALGDLGGADPAAPAFDGYVGEVDLAPHERELDALRIVVAKAFPTGDRIMDLELSRLIAMLTPLNPELLTRVVDKITPETHPVDDIHYLLTAARLNVPRGKHEQAQIAAALVDLDRKFQVHKLTPDSHWNDRIGELYEQLVALDADLPLSLLEQPGFGRPSHVIYMSKFTTDQVGRGVAAFARAEAADANYPWNNDVVFVFGFGKKDEYYEKVRQQFEKFELRMAVLLVLAESPQEQDREKFAVGLDFAPIEVLSACVGALEKLPPANNPNESIELVRLLRRLGAEKSEFPLRERVVKLLERNTGEKFDFVFGTAGYGPQPEAIARWTEWVQRKYPKETASLFGGGASDLTALQDRLKGVAWAKGDVDRGHRLFQVRGCAQCHQGGGGLGPDLAGSAGRFSREDLFVAIGIPNRDVSPRYQTMLIETRGGKVYTGMIVYEQADGLLLRNGANQTFRIEALDIESKRSLPTSLMPSGLLKDLSSGDFADLYAYLKSLSLLTAEAPADATDAPQKE